MELYATKNMKLQFYINRPYLAVSFTILSNLTGQNISKGGESIVHLLVINTLIKVLDEHITNTTPPEGGITLAPHDTHGTVLQHLEVHQIQSTLS